MLPSIADCADEYFRYWKEKERFLVEGLASNDRQERLGALQRAGGYFKVSRSFDLKHDVRIGFQRLEPALSALEAIPSSSVRDETLAEVIRGLRRELGRPYGNKDLLSAATKFLWLRYRDVAVIHDSQARESLGAAYGDYDGYLSLWRREYDHHKSSISAACLRLHTDSETSDLASAEWFMRRVFDIYLWRLGAPAKRT